MYLERWLIYINWPLYFIQGKSTHKSILVYKDFKHLIGCYYFVYEKHFLRFTHCSHRGCSQVSLFDSLPWGRPLKISLIYYPWPLPPLGLWWSWTVPGWSLFYLALQSPWKAVNSFASHHVLYAASLVLCSVIQSEQPYGCWDHASWPLWHRVHLGLSDWNIGPALYLISCWVRSAQYGARPWIPDL